MKPVFRSFAAGDSTRIRDFLVDTYRSVGKKYNWSIEAWNFTVMTRIMHGVTYDQWARGIGIWENEGKIVAVVHSEGEEGGEVFFQVADVDLPPALLEEMFAHAEENLYIEKNGKRYIQLRIPAGTRAWEEKAIDRGYVKLDWHQAISEIPVTEKRPVHLPAGFAIKSGFELDDVAKGRAHAKAFHYFDNEEYRQIAPVAFRELRKTPDYCPDLDLAVVSETGEVISFCTMWYDAVNKFGVLEPVGTIPEFRRRGMARAVIYEALNRIYRKGATKAYVGTDKPFYLKIGFERKYVINVWEKVLD